MDAPSSPPPLLAALEHHYEELVDYIRRKFGGRGFARDVVHDVCVQVMDRPPVDEIQAPLAMLRRMTSNRAIDWTRADAVRSACVESVGEVPDMHVHHDDGAQWLEGQQQLRALVRIIEALPARARQVFLLHRLHDMSQQEIADAVGISRNMVTQHFARAMRSIESDWEPARRMRAHFPTREDVLREAQTQTQRQVLRRRQGTAVVKAGATAIALAALWIVDPVWDSEQIHTAVGERSSWTLADGSRIELNTRTRLTVETRLRTRRFILVQGEASFEVAHTWRPFIVQAGVTTVRDIGTLFNVRHLEPGVRVSVIEGAVEVQHGKASRVLHAPQQVDALPHGLIEIPSRAGEDRLAWQRGNLVFDGTPLVDVAAEISRYRKAPVTVEDPAAARVRVSGAYDIHGLENLIDSLPVSLPVTVKRLRDGSVRIASRP